MNSRAPHVLVAGAVLAQPEGGVWRHNRELLPRAAARLAAQGGSLTIAAGRVPPSFSLPSSIRIETTSVPPGPPLARAWHETRELKRLFAGGRFDLIHTAHLPAPGFLGRGRELPFTLTVHDLRSLHLRSLSPLRRLVAPRLIRDATRRAQVVIAVSETIREEIEKRFHPRRTAVVPNGADHLPVLPRDVRPGAPILFIGQIERRKNLELVLRALAIDTSLPNFDAVGRARASEREYLLALAKELGVESRFRLLGPVADGELPALLAGAACFVLSSRLEGFGIPILEAARARVPIAIADAFALPEVAPPDTPRFAPDDPAACAKALRAAIETPDERLARHVTHAESYRWDASADALCSVWSEAAFANITK